MSKMHFFFLLSLWLWLFNSYYINDLQTFIAFFPRINTETLEFAFACTSGVEKPREGATLDTSLDNLPKSLLENAGYKVSSNRVLALLYAIKDILTYMGVRIYLCLFIHALLCIHNDVSVRRIYICVYLSNLSSYAFIYLCMYFCALQVERTLALLGLKRCQDTIVGNVLLRWKIYTSSSTNSNSTIK